MHLRKMFTLLFLLSIGLCGANAAEREIAFTVSDGDTTGTIYVGLDPTATDGIDASLGELLQPPKPPEGAFDARWIGDDIGLSTLLKDGILKDYRTGSSTSHLVVVHELQFQLGTGTSFTIGWSLPADVTARLQDFITGYAVNKAMTGTGTFTVPPGVNRLKLIISYKPLLCGLKVFLQGPYSTSTSTMGIALKTGGHLATHFGSMPIPGWAVDSINIEIRDAATSPTVRKYAPAWLMNDGSIRMFADTMLSYVEFDAAAGNYYIVVRHRNHLAVMTAASQALSSTSTTFDFTTGVGQYYQGDAKQLGTGVYGMYAGDANSNGQVQLDDLNDILRPMIGQAGYKGADVNLDGQIQNSDMNDYLRPNIGKGTRVP